MSCEQFKIFPYIANKNKIQVLRNHGGKTNLLRKQISRKNFRRILDVSFQSVLGHPPIPKAKKVSTSKRRLFSVRSRTSSDHVFWTKITPRLLSGFKSMKRNSKRTNNKTKNLEHQQHWPCRQNEPNCLKLKLISKLSVLCRNQNK